MFCARSRPTNRNRKQKHKETDEFYNSRFDWAPLLYKMEIKHEVTSTFGVPAANVFKIVNFTVPDSTVRELKRRLSSHSLRSANNRHAKMFLSYDSYFHFSNCANSTFASVSCRGLVAFQELWNGLFETYTTHTPTYTGWIAYVSS